MTGVTSNECGTYQLWYVTRVVTPTGGYYWIMDISYIDINISHWFNCFLVVAYYIILQTNMRRCTTKWHNHGLGGCIPVGCCGVSWTYSLTMIKLLQYLKKLGWFFITVYYYRWPWPSMNIFDCSYLSNHGVWVNPSCCRFLVSIMVRPLLIIELRTVGVVVCFIDSAGLCRTPCWTSSRWLAGTGSRSVGQRLHRGANQLVNSGRGTASAIVHV